MSSLRTSKLPTIYKPPVLYAASRESGGTLPIVASNHVLESAPRRETNRNLLGADGPSQPHCRGTPTDRIEYRPESGFWCRRCDGSSVNLYDSDLARCNTCGLETQLTLPTARHDFKMAARSVLLLITVPAGIEAAVGVLFVILTNSIESARWEVGQLWLFTGLGALVFGGMYAYRGGWVSNPNSIVNSNSDLIGWLVVSGAGLLGMGLLLVYVIH